MARIASFVKPDIQNLMAAMNVQPLPVNALNAQIPMDSLPPLPPAPNEFPSAFPLDQMQEPVQAQPASYSRPIRQQVNEAVGITPQAPQTNILDALQARLRPSLEDVSRAAVASVMKDTYVDPQEIVKQRLDQLKTISDLASGGDTPSNVREYQYFSQLNPEEQQRYLSVKRSQQWLNLGSEYRNPISGEKFAKSVPPEQMPSFKGEVTSAQEAAKSQQELKSMRPKAQAALQGFEQQSNIVTSTIDKALAEVSPWSTGYGVILQNLPNTSARKLNNYLNTIKANIGFDKLQTMRENSPTGGALGQVSDFENRLLQAVNGALDPAQSDQLVENLNVIKQLYPKVLKEKRDAFNQTFGSGEQIQQQPNQMQEFNIDSYLQEKGLQ